MKYWGCVVWMCLVGCRGAVPVEQELVGYANPELIVATEWLAGRSGAEVAIVDARSVDDYTQGHIPGAVSIPRNDTFDPDSQLRVVGRSSQIAALMGRQGIDENVHVVVYDDGLSTMAARVFWVLEYYGHPRVSVLDGGFTKWKAESREVSIEAPAPTLAVFTARAREDSLSTRTEIVSDLDKTEIVMLDSRAPAEYSGDTLHSERGGHIPDAVNIEWTQNYDEGNTPVFKSAAELKAMYAAQGVTKDKRVHAY